MICPKCKYTLPQDSEFCQYCGESLSLSIAKTEIEALYREAELEPPISSGESDAIAYCVAVEQSPELTSNDIYDGKKAFCKQCGTVIDNKTKKCPSCGKQFFFFSKRHMITISILILFILLTVLNIYQYINYRQDIEVTASVIIELEHQSDLNSTTIDDQNEELDEKNELIAELQDDIASNTTQIDLLSKKSGYFDEICDFLDSGNIGYATYNFHSSESIILVEKDQTNRKIALTAYWPYGGTVEIDNSNFLAASISFDHESWSQSTTMTINPYSEGISVITFTNDVDAQTFRIMIIVKG